MTDAIPAGAVAGPSAAKPNVPTFAGVENPVAFVHVVQNNSLFSAGTALALRKTANAPPAICPAMSPVENEKFNGVVAHPVAGSKYAPPADIPPMATNVPVGPPPPPPPPIPPIPPLPPAPPIPPELDDELLDELLELLDELATLPPIPPIPPLPPAPPIPPAPLLLLLDMPDELLLDELLDELPSPLELEVRDPVPPDELSSSVPVAQAQRANKKAKGPR